MKMKKKDNNKAYIIVIAILVIISTAFLSLAYASSSISSRMENIMASVRLQGNARITNLMLSSTSNGGTSSSESYNVSSIYSSINLPNSDSTVTYIVDATVLLGAEMKISSITGLSSNLEYEISNYTLGDVLCNTNYECTYGATDQLELTIKYKDGGYDINNTNYAISLDFLFEEVLYVARIGNTRYNTLQDAVNAVPNNTETTITLLRNVGLSEQLNVTAGKVIVFDLQNYTISNDSNIVLISNYGTIKLSNGTITSNATNGAINNESTGTLIMTGGSIIATNNKQAIYNNGGHVEISGTAYLSATSNQRAPLHNLNNGTAIVTGGTIVSTRFYGIENVATLVIGTKDGNASTSSPSIQGGTYGISSTTGYSFYDGVIAGKTAAVNDETLITDIEDNVELLHKTENSYKKILLTEIVTITFNPNGGTIDEPTRDIEKGSAIGILPTPELTDYEFKGWYTDPTNGTKVTSDMVFNADTILYAHWEEIQRYYARIGNTQYETLQKAIDAVPTDNTKVTIEVLQNITEQIQIVKNKNIELIIGNHTLRNSGTNPVIRNNGTLYISDGEILCNATQGAINNESTGHLIITGGRIEATSTRQAIYNNGGNLEISGTAYLTATTSERATVQNQANNGTITITGGTIIAKNYNAVDNLAGTLIIGTKDGNINSTNPLIIGKTNGVNNNSTFKFYDGIIKGVNKSINGNITEMETGSTLIDGTEVIDQVTYKTSHLE